MADEPKNRSGLTEQQLRDLGSAEVNMWTITKPGGKPMTLAQHHEAHLKERELQRLFDIGMAKDQEEREKAAKDFEIYQQQHPELYPSDSETI